MFAWIDVQQVINERPQAFGRRIVANDVVVQDCGELKQQQWNLRIGHDAISDHRRRVVDLHTVTNIDLEIANDAVEGADTRQRTSSQSRFARLGQNVLGSRYQEQRVAVHEE